MPDPIGISPRGICQRRKDDGLLPFLITFSHLLPFMCRLKSTFDPRLLGVEPRKEVIKLRRNTRWPFVLKSGRPEV